MEKNDVMVQLSSYVQLKIACVASVSSRGSSRKLGQEQKKMNDGGGGGERPPSTFFLLPL